MRLALLSYSHHGRSLGRVARSLGHEITGVMDGEEEPRRALEREFECPAFATAAACLDGCTVDAAVVAGKHIEMPGHIMACVDRRIPYLVDKPFADCAARLRPVAEASERYGVFSALTLPNRASVTIALVQQMIDDGSLGELVLYNSRLNNGPPSRYDGKPSAWHNDASVSGGGCWAVEASHGLDTFLDLVGDQEVVAVSGVMSNALHRRAVEDSAIGVLRARDGATGIVETGYCYPSGARSGDHFFRFVGTKATVIQQYDSEGGFLIEVHTPEGVRVSRDIGHGERMERIVDEALTALAEGRPFTPGIGEAVRILEAQDAVYACARSSSASHGPHRLGTPPPRP